jgi:glycosyltransferase involved in cell wall biosynthesis
VEVIVIDDASTDETPAVLAGFAGRVRSHRLERNSGGPARPRNAAIALARGEYVSIFDSDDVMHPEKLARQVGFLERHRDVPLVFSDFENFDADGRVERFLERGHDAFARMEKVALGSGACRLRSADAFDTLIADNFVGTSGIVMRRGLVAEVGGFDERLSNSDDIDFLLRAARRHDFGFLDSVLHRRRIHAANISGRVAAIQAKECVYERLRDAQPPLSDRARANLSRMLADVYFSRGYWERRHGSRRLALRYYYRSWTLQKARLSVAKSALRALLPF